MRFGEKKTAPCDLVKKRGSRAFFSYLLSFILSSILSIFFSRVLRDSIHHCWSVGRSVGWSVGRSVGHNYGVNDVFVSSIPFRRPKHGNDPVKEKVQDFNNILRERAVCGGFMYIDNNAIVDRDIARDGVHLKYNGTCILADNFIAAINGLRRR